MNAKELGIFSGCLDLGVDYSEFNKYAGFVAAIESSSESKKHAAIVTNSYLKILDNLGLQNESVYPIIKAAVYKAKHDAWDSRCDAVADGIYDTIGRFSNFSKIAGLADAAGLGVKGVMATSALAGMGAGALYWTLKRDSQEESVPNEKLRAQIDYYRNLSKDVEGSIERRMKSTAAQNKDVDVG